MAKKAKKKTARKKVSKKKAVKKNIKKTAKKKSPKKTAAKKKKTTRKPKTPKTSMSDILGALNQLNTKVEKLLVLVEKPKTVSSAEEIKPGTQTVVPTGNNVDFISNSEMEKTFKASETNGQAEVTLDELTNALQEVGAKKGLPEVKSLLEQFGASRVSEIKQSDYAAFIKECHVQTESSPKNSASPQVPDFLS